MRTKQLITIICSSIFGAKVLEPFNILFGAIANNKIVRFVMEQVVLVIHLLLAIGLVAAVLLQRSEGGGLGMGGSGSGGGMGGLMTGRATADLLTRTTAFLAAGFMITSLLLTIFAGKNSAPESILDEVIPNKVVPQESNEPVAPIAK